VGHFSAAPVVTVTVVLGFTLLCLLLAVTPGPDTFLVLRYGLAGARPGIAAAAGSGLGSLFWAATVAVGLAAALRDCATAFAAVKAAGGIYLLYLGGVGLLRRPAEGPSTAPVRVRARSTSGGTALRSGFYSCLLNPKVGLFFLAIVPQIIPAEGVSSAAILLLGLIDGIVAALWLSVVAISSARASLWLARPRVTLALDRISSAVLLVLGLVTLAATLR
jgi:threonine/homoserine/homoserine lactone efflux protein